MSRPRLNRPGAKRRQKQQTGSPREPLVKAQVGPRPGDWFILNGEYERAGFPGEPVVRVEDPSYLRVARLGPEDIIEVERMNFTKDHVMKGVWTLTKDSMSAKEIKEHWRLAPKEEVLAYRKQRDQEWGEILRRRPPAVETAQAEIVQRRNEN